MDIKHLTWTGISFAAVNNDKVLLLEFDDKQKAEKFMTLLQTKTFRIANGIDNKTKQYKIQIEFDNIDTFSFDSKMTEDILPQLIWLRQGVLTHVGVAYVDSDNRLQYFQPFQKISENQLNLN